jgi:hypothetical protein
MIDTTGKIEMTNGRKTRWVSPDSVEDLKQQGFVAVNQPVISMKPTRARQQTADDTKPTLEE